MKRFKSSFRAGAVVAMMAMSVIPATVQAEVFMEIYGGKSLSKSGNVNGRYRQNGILLDLERGDFDGSDSGTGGFRAGYWFRDANWLGVALDMSYFDADAQYSSIEVSVLPISALVMFRYPMLVSEDFPNGRFYPYVGAGLTLAAVDISSNYSGLFPDDYYYGDYDGDGGYGYGADLRAGVTWQFNRTVGLFVEYRYTSLQIDYNEEDRVSGWWWHSMDYDGDLQAQFVVGGISIHLY